MDPVTITDGKTRLRVSDLDGCVRIVTVCQNGGVQPDDLELLGSPDDLLTVAPLTPEKAWELVDAITRSLSAIRYERAA